MRPEKHAELRAQLQHLPRDVVGHVHEQPRPMTDEQVVAAATLARADAIGDER